MISLAFRRMPWFRTHAAAACLLLFLLAGCKAKQAAPPPIIDGAGGTVTEPSGATVVVPEGALATATTIRIARDATGAPQLPTGVTTGDVFAITPHGATFDQPVEVRLPRPAAALKDNERWAILQAEVGEGWVEVPGVVERDGQLVAEVRGFSFFLPMIISYALPLPTAAPLTITATLTAAPVDPAVEGSLVCRGNLRDPCAVPAGWEHLTLSWTVQGGQLTTTCQKPPSLEVLGWPGAESTFPLASGTTTATVGGAVSSIAITVGARCGAAPLVETVAFRLIFGPGAIPYPRVRMVTQRGGTGVEGSVVSLDHIYRGGPSGPAALPSGSFPPPTPPLRGGDRAVIDWEQSFDGQRSWIPIARSYQDEADPVPFGAHLAPWRYWGVRHAFVATHADKGSWIRSRACYSPPPPAEPGNYCDQLMTQIQLVDVAPPPVIVDAPRPVLVRVGQTASFTVTASGLPAPTLLWQTREANWFGPWQDVMTGTGATASTYTTIPQDLSDNGRQYRVVVTNPGGFVVSAPVTVSVYDVDVAPTITTQPASLAVVEGGDAVFAVAARGTEALGYEWRRDGAPIAGANGPILRLAAASAAQAGVYMVHVSNAAGSVDSDPATLTVTPAFVPVAPTIVTPPGAVTVNAGNTATFAAGVAGTGPFAYQWLKDGQPIAGATAAYHAIAAASLADAGTFAVRVSNGVGPGVTSAGALLTVLPAFVASPATIVTQPSPQVVAPGGSATFAVGATGSGPMTFQWLKGGVPIAGATGPVLVVSSVSAADAATYAVTVSNADATVTSDGASLVVLGAPVITVQPASTTVTEGSAATFTVQASGGALRYLWLRNGVTIPDATGPSYTTPTLALADGGAVYQVVVSNGAGAVLSSPVSVAVQPAVLPSGMALYAGNFTGGGGGGAVDGVGAAALFDDPQGLTSDAAGDLYVAQANGQRVARIAPGAVVTTVMSRWGIAQYADRSNMGYVGLAPDGALFTAGISYCGLFRTSPPLDVTSLTEVLVAAACPGTETRGMAIDAAGNVYLSAYGSSSIARVVPAGPGAFSVTVVAGPGNPFVPGGSVDGDGAIARFNGPRGIAFGPDGNLYIADSGNQTIRRMTPLGSVSTYAGATGLADTVDGAVGAGGPVRFDTPRDLAFDTDGNLVVLQVSATTGVAHVRRISPAGEVTTLFDATAEALALAQPGQEPFARNIKGLALLGTRRVALTAGNAVLVRNLP